MMTSPSLYLFSALGSPVVPTALIINTGHAGLFLAVVLAVACLALWFLTRPARDSDDPNKVSRLYGKRMQRPQGQGQHPRPAFVSHRTG